MDARNQSLELGRRDHSGVHVQPVLLKNVLNNCVHGQIKLQNPLQRNLVNEGRGRLARHVVLEAQLGGVQLHSKIDRYDLERVFVVLKTCHSKN